MLLHSQVSKLLLTGGSQACERFTGPDDPFSRRRPALRGLPPRVGQGAAALHHCRGPFEERAPTPHLLTQGQGRMQMAHASEGSNQMLGLTTHTQKGTNLFPLLFGSWTLQCGEKRPRATKDCEMNVWPSKSQDKGFTLLFTLELSEKAHPAFLSTFYGSTSPLKIGSGGATFTSI